MLKINHVQQTTTNHSYKPVSDKNTPNGNKSNTQASTVIISDESQNKYIQSLKFKEVIQDDVLGRQFRKFHEAYNSSEAIEQRRLEQLEKEQTYNPLTDEFNLRVKGNFPENTLYHTITEALEGKVVKAWVYAAELTGAIRSAVSMRDKSTEERAAYREMALKQADYIAENYFDDEEEATSFMNEINKYYENDILREKGYVVFDNSDLKPFKNYSSPLSNGNDVSFYTLAKRYMDEDYFERFVNGKGTSKEFGKFLMQLKNNKEKYSKEIRKEFELNEQLVEEQITATKSMVESFVWENGLVVGAMEKQPNYLGEIVKWNKDMLNLFY